jgi:hypothetical protein
MRQPIARSGLLSTVEGLTVTSKGMKGERVRVELQPWEDAASLQPRWVAHGDLFVLSTVDRRCRRGYDLVVGGTVVFRVCDDGSVPMIEVVWPFKAWSGALWWPRPVEEAMEGRRPRAVVAISPHQQGRQLDRLHVRVQRNRAGDQGWITWAEPDAGLRGVCVSESCTALLEGDALVGFFVALPPVDWST